MNPELKAKWLDMLTSGKYPQCVGYLHNPEGYCCLGVLLEADEVESYSGYTPSSCDPCYRYKIDEQHVWSYPPDSYYIKINLNQRVAEEAAKMNDRGATFHQIASYLETNA